MIQAKHITAQLGGNWHGNNGTCRCPAHDDRTPSLSIRDSPDNGIIVHCFSGCDWRDVKAAMREIGLLPDFHTEGRTVPADNRNGNRAEKEAQAAAKRAHYIKWCQSIWDAAGEVKSSPVESYLRSRAITSSPSTLRCHRALKDSATGLNFPAMVAAVTRWPNDDVIGIHRTFLNANGDGKADIQSPKKMAGDCLGGAVQLASAGTTLGLSEGIESGLAAMQATSVPTWATLSVSGLRGIIVPDESTDIIIFADHDASGINAANQAADRFRSEGKRARIALPPNPGTDFNDLLLKGMEL